MLDHVEVQLTVVEHATSAPFVTQKERRKGHRKTVVMRNKHTLLRVSKIAVRKP